MLCSYGLHITLGMQLKDLIKLGSARSDPISFYAPSSTLVQPHQPSNASEQSSFARIG